MHLEYVLRNAKKNCKINQFSMHEFRINWIMFRIEWLRNDLNVFISIEKYYMKYKICFYL